jgi:hypothetical protein
MSKDNKNEMTKDPEDQRRDFPRGAPASAGLDEERRGAEPPPNRRPSEGGAADERRLRFPPAGNPGS